MPSFQHLHTLRYKLRSFLLTHRGRPKWMHFFSTGHTEMDAHVTKTFCGFVAGLTEMEQNFSARTARKNKVDTGVTSASSVSGSPGGSSPSLEQVDCSPATGSRYQGSSNENRNTRRRLDTDKSPDDENARSAVLTTRYDPSAKCLLPRNVSYSRAKSPDFLFLRSTDFRCEEYNSCPSIRIIRMARDRSAFAPLWDVLIVKLQKKFFVEDTESTYVVPTIDFRAQVHSSTSNV